MVGLNFWSTSCEDAAGARVVLATTALARITQRQTTAQAATMKALIVIARPSGRPAITRMQATTTRSIQTK